MKRFKAAGGGYLQRIAQRSSSHGDAEDHGEDVGDHGEDVGDHGEDVGPPSEYHAKSELATILQREMLWGFGGLHPTKVQRLARAAVRDGLTHPALLKLAKLGSHGKHPCHAWRDYKDTHEPPAMLGAIGYTRIPLKHGTDAIKWDQVALLYPHKLFATLHDSHPSAFREHMLGGDARKLPAFWAEMVDQPGVCIAPNAPTSPL